MDAKTFINEYARMCNNNSCHSCPAYNECETGSPSKYKENIVDVVEKWSNEHSIHS